MKGQRSKTLQYLSRGSSLKGLLAIVLGLLIIIASSVSYFSTIDFSDRMKITNSVGSDTNNNGLVDSIELSLDVPSQGVLVTSVAVVQNEVYKNWTTNAAIEAIDPNQQSLRISTHKASDEVLTVLTIGVALFYTVAGDSTNKTAAFEFTVDFIMPIATHVIGYYTNMIAPEGWIDKKAIEPLATAFASTFNAIKHDDTILLPINERSIEYFINNSRPDTDWLLFGTDVVPKNLVPIAIYRTSILASYFDSHANMGFIGGNPLGFAYNEENKLIETPTTFSLVTDTNSLSSTKILQSTGIQSSFTEIGNGVTNNLYSDLIYFQFKSFDSAAIGPNQLQVRKYGENPLGNYIDPVGATSNDGNELFFAFLQYISKDSATLYGTLSAYFFADYLYRNYNVSYTSSSEKSYDFNQNNLVDAFSVTLQDFPLYANITNSIVTVANNQTKLTHQFSPAQLTEAKDATFEVNLIDEVPLDTPLILKLAVDADSNGELDYYASISMHPTDFTIVDQFIYTDIAIPAIQSSIVYSSYLQAINASIIAGGILKAIITHSYITTISTLTPIFPSEVFVNNSLTNWIAAGGNLISVGGPIGYMQYENKTLSSASVVVKGMQFILNLLNVSSTAANYSTLDFNYTTNASTLFSLDGNFITHFSVNTTTIDSTNFMVLASSNNMTASFVVKHGKGNFALLANTALSESVLTDTLGKLTTLFAGGTIL